MVILLYIRKVPNFYPKQLPPCVSSVIIRILEYSRSTYYTDVHTAVCHTHSTAVDLPDVCTQLCTLRYGRTAVCTVVHTYSCVYTPYPDTAVTHIAASSKVTRVKNEAPRYSCVHMCTHIRTTTRKARPWARQKGWFGHADYCNFAIFLFLHEIFRADCRESQDATF